MSRLQSLNIPFAAGHSDEVDEKLLPNGVFADVQNGRLPQLGSLRLRRGWRPVTMNALTSGSTLTACDLFSTPESLTALTVSGSENALRVATLVESNASRPWVLDTDSGLAPATQVRDVGSMPAMAASITNASAAVTSDGIYGCVLERSTGGETFVRVFEMETDDTITLVSLTNGGRIRKAVSMGTSFGIVENTTAGLDLYSLTPSASTPAFALVATLFAAVVDSFDVATATETTPTALHVTDVVGGLVSYRQFTFAGAQTGSTKTVAAAGASSAVICCDDTTAHVLHRATATGELTLLSFAATGAFTTSAGPTAVEAGVATPEGNYAVGQVATSASGQTAFTRSVWVAFNITGAPDTRIRSFTTSHSAAGSSRFERERLQCGWLIRQRVAAVGVVRGVAGQQPVSEYHDMFQTWFVEDYGTGTAQAVTAMLWPGLAPTGDALVLFHRDLGVSPGVIPTCIGVRSVKIRSTERRPSAQLSGAVYVAGGSLTQIVGGALAEQGILAPILDSLTASNTASGAIANGDYTYRAVCVWEDQKQNTHRSVVSFAGSVTIAGADDTVTVVVAVAKSLRRSPNLIINPRVELFRTEAGPGALFYLCASLAVSATDDLTSVVDTMADATLITQPQLYTQGETGATSGILDACPASPCAFVAATKRRLVCGSADTSYQFSQVQFPETQVWFAQPGIVGDPAQAYLDDVDGGRITSVAALDELVFVGTRDRLYVTGGVGPNLAGVGEFDAPHRLPTDFGFYNHFTILETSEGLWFQGSADGMCLLPRGASTPTPDHSVQDRLASGLVGCGYDTTDNVAVWATSGATALVRHLDFKLWVGDSLPFTPIALIGHRGRLYAVASDGVVWAQEATAFGDGASGATAVVLRVTTGSAEPFEMAGQGRLAAVELLGEFQAAAAVLGEISYDDGLTWTSLGTHTVTGLSVGESFRKQWYPSRQRGDRFRFRVTMTPSVTTTEGCRLTGLTVYYTKARGPSRLASADRR